MQLGYSARQRGDHAEALAHFKAAASASPADPTPQIEMAFELVQLGRPAEAEMLLRAALERAPHNAAALIRLGSILRQQGDHAAAVTSFEAAHAADPSSIWPRLELAQERMHQRQFDEAEKLLHGVLAQRPRQPLALARLGHLARQRGDTVAALGCFAAAAAMEPSNVTHQVEIAFELAQGSRLVEAEAVLRALLDERPHHAQALHRLGMVLRQQGDRDAALAHFKAAHAAEPAGIWPRLEMANEYMHRREFEAALALLQGILAQEPDQPVALARLGYIARQRGDRVGALARFEAAAAADPGNPTLRCEVMQELRELGRFEEAGQAAEAILASDPRHLPAWIQRGLIERWRGDHAAALRLFRQALEIDPGSASLLVEIAQEERALGNPGASEARLQEALQREPGNLSALMNLAEHAWQGERHEECLALCRRAIAANPDTQWPWPYLTLSRALDVLSGREAALGALDEAEDRIGRRPELLVRRLELLQQAGEFGAMREALLAAGALVQESHGLWSQKVQLHLRLGELEEAAAALRNPVAQSVRDHANLAMLRGQLAEAEWRLEDAEAAYAEALRLHPDHAWTHHEISRLCLLRLDLDGARAHLRQWVGLQKAAKQARRESLNISQSHIGQLLDEFVLDDSLRRQVAALQPLAPGERIGPLLRLVAQNPDHTPAAMCLLVALRQAGQLSLRRGGEASMPELPARIAQFWAGAGPSEDLQQLMRSWQALNPSHAYRCFDEDGAQAFLARHCEPRVLDAFRRAEHPAKKADIFRLAWLFVEGGVYVDADDRCLAPLSGLLPPHAGFLAYQEEYGTLGNNILAARPGHPVTGRALHMATEAVNRADADMLWLATGPGLLTRAFCSVLAEAPDPMEWLRGVAVLERRELARGVAIHCWARYKMTERHWSRSVFRRKADQRRSRRVRV